MMTNASQWFLLGVLSAATANAFVLPLSTASRGMLRRSNVVQGTSYRSRPAASIQGLNMGIKAVESYDASFVLNPEVRAKIESLLRHKKMEAAVVKAFEAEGATFADILFQPVPYSEATPHGMPADCEQYHLRTDYGIVNVPPTVMFDAKCFKPSRLCAVFQITGMSEAMKGKIVSQREALERQRVRGAGPSESGTPSSSADAWAGLGSAIAEASRMDPMADLTDAELDSMVV